jgi:uncharacterized protein (DUF302 family)
MSSQLAADAPARKPQYGFGVRLCGTSIEKARSLASAALAAEGFTVLTEVDIGGMLKKPAAGDPPHYLILTACNPSLSGRALEIEPYSGLLLPCNVTIWQEANEVVVTIESPEVMMTVLGDERLRPLAVEAERRLRSALHRILA